MYVNRTELCIPIGQAGSVKSQYVLKSRKLTFFFFTYSPFRVWLTLQIRAFETYYLTWTYFYRLLSSLCTTPWSPCHIKIMNKFYLLAANKCKNSSFACRNKIDAYQVCRIDKCVKGTEILTLAVSGHL